MRGLKVINGRMACKCKSHLAQGAWIEVELVDFVISIVTSHLARGAWIEVGKVQRSVTAKLKSHLARGAWIKTRQ